MKAVLTHPVAKSVLVALLTGSLAWASGNQTGTQRATARERANCDSTKTTLLKEIAVVTHRADSLQRVIVRRDEAYARHVARRGSEGAVSRSEERGKAPWLVAAGSFVLGGVVGYLIGDGVAGKAVAIATATASSRSDHGGHHGHKHPKKKKYHRR